LDSLPFRRRRSMSDASLPEAVPINTQTVTLQVNIPPEVAVGSTINVLFEGNYYSIIVPEGSPGNTIQVVLPNVTLDEKIDTATAWSVNEKPEDAPVDSETQPERPKVNSAVMTGMAVGAVVGAIVIGPIVTGAIVLGGAAVYVASRKKNAPGEEEKPDIFDKASAAVKDFDSKYQVSSTATKVVHASVEKCREIDEKNHISDTVHGVAVTIATKCKETDEKYHITAKANTAMQSTVAAVQNFDEKHQLTAKAQATAVSAVNKAKELDSKYEVSSSISKAFTSFSQNLTQMTKDLAKTTTSDSSDPAADKK